MPPPPASQPAGQSLCLFSATKSHICAGVILLYPRLLGGLTRLAHWSHTQHSTWRVVTLHDRQLTGAEMAQRGVSSRKTKCLSGKRHQPGCLLPTGLPFPSSACQPCTGQETPRRTGTSCSPGTCPSHQWAKTHIHVEVWPHSVLPWEREGLGPGELVGQATGQGGCRKSTVD